MKIKLFGYTFTLEQEVEIVKPERKHTVGFTAKRWSEEDTAKLLKMQADGKTPVGMARSLGRTTAAINSRLWKLREH